MGIRNLFNRVANGVSVEEIQAIVPDILQRVDKQEDVAAKIDQQATLQQLEADALAAKALAGKKKARRISDAVNRFRSVTGVK
jgi:hypothetical protein